MGLKLLLRKLQCTMQWKINQILVLDNQLDSGAGQSTGFRCWTINRILVLDNQPDSGAGKSTGFQH